MKHRWTDLGSVIGVSSAVVVIYMLSILFEPPVVCVLCLFLSSLIALVWMVIKILKDAYSTDKTFDEYFYQDRAALRRNDGE